MGKGGRYTARTARVLLTWAGRAQTLGERILLSRVSRAHP